MTKLTKLPSLKDLQSEANLPNEQKAAKLIHEIHEINNEIGLKQNELKKLEQAPPSFDNKEETKNYITWEEAEIAADFERKYHDFNNQIESLKQQKERLRNSLKDLLPIKNHWIGVEVDGDMFRVLCQETDKGDRLIIEYPKYN